MALLDIFRSNKKVETESNTVFGQTQLGNNVIYQGQGGKQTVGMQLLYVTTSSTTTAGRTVDISVLTRNSTIMACVGIKARALSQLPKEVMVKLPDGSMVNALTSDKVGSRDKIKAKQIVNLLYSPNNFQSS